MSSFHKIQPLECLSAFRILTTIPQPLSHFSFRILPMTIMPPSRACEGDDITAVTAEPVGPGMIATATTV